MIKKPLILVALLSLAVSFTGSIPSVTGATNAAGPAPVTPASPATNLLANGYMDGGFYWRPTNHFVANGWYEWWYQGEIPEFIDGGGPHHNQCYPEPAPGGLCGDTQNHSQGYIRKGPPVIAGVYQHVAVTACATFRFEAYNRNDNNNYHPRVGIEPTGWTNPRPYYDVPPYDCPPSGNSVCPNPSLQIIPDSIVWSPEFDHAAFTWESQSVTAEALSSTITVFTYAATPEGVQSVYWDYTSLVQVPATTLLPDGVIPEPDGKLTGLTVTPSKTGALIQWSTDAAAFSQVYYRVHPTLTITDTSDLTNTIYLPIIARAQAVVTPYPFKTTPTMSPLKGQAVTLTGLASDTAYEFVAVSRWFNGATCVPSVSATGIFTTTP